MNRRQFSISIAVSSVALVAGCDDTPKPSTSASLTNADGIKSAVDQLDSIAGNLEEDSENFDGDNWRDVVPEVKEHVESLRGAIDDLMVALGYKTS